MILTTPQVAAVRAEAGRFRIAADVTVTPAGMLAIGGLVAAILLSVPPIIRAAGTIAADRRRAERLPAR